MSGGVTEIYKGRIIANVADGYIVMAKGDFDRVKKYDETEEKIIENRLHFFHPQVHETRGKAMTEIDRIIEMERDPQAERQRRIAEEKRNELFVKDKKLRKAILAGARIGEKSLSKIHWDIAHDKIKVTQGKIDYQIHWVLDCVADQIAQEKWFGMVMFNKEKESERPNILEEPERFIVIIEYSSFRKFLGRNIKTKEAEEIFDRLPDITLKGNVKIPYCLADKGWLELEDYKDNICGVLVARETKEFEGYRSERKMRGKGTGKEEPVFILVFSNPYGKALFRNAMQKAGNQLVNHKVYSLSPEVQDLFQAVRWKDDDIFLNTEQICKMVGWIWPTANIVRTVDSCQKLLAVLHDSGYVTRAECIGKTSKTRAWRFRINKVKCEKIIGNVV